MSAADPGERAGLWAVAFMSDDAAIWGAALAHPADCRLVSGRAAGSSAPEPARLTEEADGGWRIASPEGSGGAPLSLEATALAAPTPAAEASSQEPDARLPPGAEYVPGRGPELCRLSGTLHGERLDAWAVRVRMGSPFEEAGSVRLVAGWFVDGSALALIAARPRRPDRPDQDATSATVFDPERWLTVSDPRLSTTYDAAGTPARVNLELWIGEGEHEYPRRAAGEASGPPSGDGAAAESAALQVTPLRCHSHGEDGTGLYVLARL